MKLSVSDPLMRPIEAAYGILNHGNIAVIEMAAASGLTLLQEKEQNPMFTTTYGTGEMIKDALLKGCCEFLIGIGGSATNDAGTGMLRALGFKFINSIGKETKEGGQSLSLISSVDDSSVLPLVKMAKFTVACDVNNPFSGPNGAAYVYAPQKGANLSMVKVLDKGLDLFNQLVLRQKQIDLNEIPGAGAAGGLGGGLHAFLNASLKPGIEMVLDAVNFEAHLKGADLVITGEGKLDRQTCMGKTPAGILKLASILHVPVIAIGGSVQDIECLNDSGFVSVYAVTQGAVALAEAMEKENAIKNIRSTVSQLMRTIKCFNGVKKN